MSEALVVKVSPSTLNDMALCSQRFHLAKELRLTKYINDPALDFGTLIHAMLEHYYKGRMAGKPVAELLQTGVQLGDYKGLTLDLPLSEQEEAKQMYRDYIHHYLSDPWIPLGAEAPFLRELYKDDILTILIEGKIDLFVKNTNAQFPVDHKSESRKTPISLASNQFPAYCWATGTNQLVVNKLGRQKTLSIADRFYRKTICYDDSLLEEWRQDAIYWVLRILSEQKEGYYPRNRTSCDKYWKGCQFKGLCFAPPNLRAERLTTEYKVRSDHNIFTIEKDDEEA